jgi:3-deoxy-D-manno-octulosonate 8-phosphate phosphatase KdsC-like HAD superfamily phosphatase
MLILELSNIKLVLFDVDGVLTDGAIYDVFLNKIVADDVKILSNSICYIRT